MKKISKEEILLDKVYTKCIDTLKLIKDNSEYDDTRKDIQKIVKDLMKKSEKYI
ncbi:hypothetical protein [uncultured Clostridium sp.]|uniref:hypothetical protein n=1 Tax=uncultured Clostridium sp. TaxID=59620 RepID=UPI0032180E1E